MFGLMKSCTCLQTSGQKHHRRLHYCGTCKTIGGMYGWKSRVLLNNDAVFLAELLSASSGTDMDLDRWNRAYQSYSCLSVPEDPENMPLPLQFAATATVINAQFKIADRIIDSNAFPWRLPGRFFSSSFGAASERLKLWGFPLAALWECLNDQQKREAEAQHRQPGRSAEELLAHLTGPTGTVTGLFFKHGAKLTGSRIDEEAMTSIGRCFGAMIYLLDALEDYKKDFKNRHFNALRASYGLSCPVLPLHFAETAKQIIRDHAARIQELLEKLPIDRTLSAHFIDRLQTNISIRLGGRRPLSSRACGTVSKPVMGLRERMRTALEVGKSMTGGFAETGLSFFRPLQASLVFVSASAAGFVMPDQARSATTYRECMEKFSNLTLLSSALAAPSYFSWSTPPGAGPELPDGSDLPGTPGKARRGWCGGGPDGDGGEACCNGCNCCCDCSWCSGDCCSADCCSGDCCSCDC